MVLLNGVGGQQLRPQMFDAQNIGQNIVNFLALSKSPLLNCNLSCCSNGFLRECKFGGVAANVYLRLENEHLRRTVTERRKNASVSRL